MRPLAPIRGRVRSLNAHRNRGRPGCLRLPRIRWGRSANCWTSSPMLTAPLPLSPTIVTISVSCASSLSNSTLFAVWLAIPIKVHRGPLPLAAAMALGLRELRVVLDLDLRPALVVPIVGALRGQVLLELGAGLAGRNALPELHVLLVPHLAQEKGVLLLAVLLEALLVIQLPADRRSGTCGPLRSRVHHQGQYLASPCFWVSLKATLLISPGFRSLAQPQEAPHPIPARCMKRPSSPNLGEVACILAQVAEVLLLLGLGVEVLDGCTGRRSFFSSLASQASTSSFLQSPAQERTQARSLCRSSSCGSSEGSVPQVPGRSAFRE